jgi:hypothetical protein
MLNFRVLAYRQACTLPLKLRGFGTFAAIAEQTTGEHRQSRRLRENAAIRIRLELIV